MENIKLVCTNKTDNTRFDSESQNSVLYFVLRFQNQLTIESLFSAFDECIQSVHAISGIRYRYPLLGISHTIGNRVKQQCCLQIQSNDEFLGDITIFHNHPISRPALNSIELITSLVTHPLRAIIQDIANASLGCNNETIGVANATLVEQLVTREAKLAHREHVDMSLILFDIDRFNMISEARSFIIRDEILYQVMKVIRYHIRDTDLLFRYENDTYCLILKGVNTHNALLISERVRQAIDRYDFDIGNIKTHITISTGIAKLESNDSIESIFTRAIHATQHAKKMGRNQSIIADGTFIS